MTSVTKEPTCYLCDSLLTPTNRTVEHIILNAMGGRLKSDKILCKKCNSSLGADADAALAGQFAFLSGYLQVNRENGSIPTTTGLTTADGTEYRLLNGNKPSLARPVFRTEKTENGFFYSLTARTDAEMRSMLGGIKKQFPAFDVEEGLRQAKVYDERLREPISIRQEFGGEPAFRSIAKSAVNFYLHQGGDRSQVQHLFDMIRGIAPCDVVRFYNPTRPLYQLEPNSVLHVLHVQGIKHIRLLYCYVEFFSTHSFIVILNDNYEGRNIGYTYSGDPVTGKKVEKEIKLILSREEILGLSHTDYDYEALSSKTRRLIRIADERLQKAEIGRIFREGIKDVHATQFRGETVFTRPMAKAFADRVTRDIMRYLYGS